MPIPTILPLVVSSTVRTLARKRRGLFLRLPHQRGLALQNRRRLSYLRRYCRTGVLHRRLRPFCAPSLWVTANEVAGRFFGLLSANWSTEEPSTQLINAQRSCPTLTRSQAAPQGGREKGGNVRRGLMLMLTVVAIMMAMTVVSATPAQARRICHVLNPIDWWVVTG
jgi:hypothetical protein